MAEKCDAYQSLRNRLGLPTPSNRGFTARDSRTLPFLFESGLESYFDARRRPQSQRLWKLLASSTTTIESLVNEIARQFVADCTDCDLLGRQDFTFGIAPLSGNAGALVIELEVPIVLVDEGLVHALWSCIPVIFGGFSEDEMSAIIEQAAQRMGSVEDQRSACSNPTVLEWLDFEERMPMLRLFHSAVTFAIARQVGRFVANAAGDTLHNEGGVVLIDSDVDVDPKVADTWAIQTLETIAAECNRTSEDDLIYRTAGPMLCLGIELVVQELQRRQGLTTAAVSVADRITFLHSQMSAGLFHADLDGINAEQDFDFLTGYIQQMLLGGGILKYFAFSDAFLQQVVIAHKRMFEEECETVKSVVGPPSPTHHRCLGAFGIPGRSLFTGASGVIAFSYHATTRRLAVRAGASAMAVSGDLAAIGTNSGLVALVGPHGARGITYVGNVVAALAFGKEETVLYIATEDGRLLKKTLLGDRKEPNLIDRFETGATAIATCSSYIAIGDQSMVHVRRLPSMELHGSCTGKYFGFAFYLKWAVGYLFVGSLDGEVTCVNPNFDFRAEYTIKVGEAAIVAIDWSSDTRMLLAASEEGNLVMWNVNVPSEVNRLSNAGKVIAAAFDGLNRIRVMEVNGAVYQRSF